MTLEQKHLLYFIKHRSYEKYMSYKKTYETLKRQLGSGAGFSVMKEEPVAELVEKVEEKIPSNINSSDVRQRIYSLINGSTRDQSIYLTASMLEQLNVSPLKDDPDNIFYIKSIDEHIPIKDAVLSLIQVSIKGIHIRDTNSYKLMKLLNLTFSGLFPSKQLIYREFIAQEFNIFGCPLSSDIDIAIKIPLDIEKHDVNFSIIEKKLIDAGYDLSRGIDFNLVVVDDKNNIIRCSKGTHEIQNMVYYTYKFHKQQCPPIFTSPYIFTFDVICNKLLYVYKYAISIKDVPLFPDIYTEYSKIRYEMPRKRLILLNNILHHFRIINLNSQIKALCVKMFQAIIIFTSPDDVKLIYAKSTLALLMASKFNLEYNYILALITRGKYGTIDLDEINTCFQKILREFINLVAGIPTFYIDNMFL